MRELDKKWYLERLDELKQEFRETDNKYSKRKIDILQQMHLIEDILKLSK